MSTPNDPLAPINQALDKLASDLTDKFSAITTEITDLKTQVANGIPVTQAQLDSVLAKVLAADATVTNFSA